MTGRNTPCPESMLHLLREAGIDDDPALVQARQDIGLLAEGPAPDASAELAQLMADGGRANGARRTKGRITFIGGALAVCMGVGMSGVAAGTAHLQPGFDGSVDSVTRFSARDHVDRAAPLPLDEPSAAPSSGLSAAPLDAPSAAPPIGPSVVAPPPDAAASARSQESAPVPSCSAGGRAVGGRFGRHGSGQWPPSCTARCESRRHYRADVARRGGGAIAAGRASGRRRRSADVRGAGYAGYAGYAVKCWEFRR